MKEEAGASAPASRPWWKDRRNRTRLAILAAVLAVVVGSIVLSERLGILSTVGYPAVALLSFFSSASLFLPVPGLAAVCAAGYALSPSLVALLAAAGMALGELTGYFVGVSGRGFLEKRNTYLRMEGWMRRHGGWVLFIFSVIPNPFFDLAGMAAGALHYPIWRFLAIIYAGKLVKTLAVAYGCAYGVEAIVRWVRA